MKKFKKYIACTDLDSGFDVKKEFQNLADAKTFLKGRCAKGYINGLPQNSPYWIRLFEYDTDLQGSFKRSKDGRYYDKSHF